jgi:hypothetical protein
MRSRRGPPAGVTVGTGVGFAPPCAASIATLHQAAPKTSAPRPNTYFVVMLAPS